MAGALSPNWKKASGKELYAREFNIEPIDFVNVTKLFFVIAPRSLC